MEAMLVLVRVPAALMDLAAWAAKGEEGVDSISTDVRGPVSEGEGGLDSGEGRVTQPWGRLKPEGS